MQHLHFCGGLPRTGSTVLMNILQQNPDIFTTSTDPLPGILQNQLLTKARFTEMFQAMSCKQADDAMHGMVLGATKGWYEGLSSKPIVISKGRDWSNLTHIFPKSKIIVTVRDLRDIIESFDRVNAKIKALHTFGDDNTLYGSMTEDEKYHYHFKEQNAFSSVLTSEIPKYLTMFKQDSKRIKFVRYEDLLQDPVYMLNQIYKFLELNTYKHDLNNIAQSAVFEHDNAYFREKTDHKTKPQMIKWSEPKRILSKDFHTKVIDTNKWFYQAFYPEVLS